VRRLWTSLLALVVMTTLASAVPERIHVSSPLPVEYNVVNGAIMLHIDTNYVVPNTKYSVTAEIEKNTGCKGCYNVYLVLHTPATPGYAWNPRKLAPILAVIHPDATEKNVNIRVIPLGNLKNAESAAESAARCGALRAEATKMYAKIEMCKIAGCDENEVQQIREEWNKIRTNNIKQRCGIALPLPPTEAVASEINVSEIMGRYITQDASILTVKREENVLHIETLQKGRILGIIPVSIQTTIEITGTRVSIRQPWWYSILHWIIW